MKEIHISHHVSYQVVAKFKQEELVDEIMRALFEPCINQLRCFVSGSSNDHHCCTNFTLDFLAATKQEMVNTVRKLALTYGSQLGDLIDDSSDAEILSLLGLKNGIHPSGRDA